MKLFVNNITTIDFSVLHPGEGIVGDSFIVDVTLEGDLNPEGMIMDFSLVKKIIKQEVDSLADHVLVVPDGNDNIRVNQSEFRCDIILHSPDGQVKCFVSAPKKSFLLLNSAEFSTEKLEGVIEKQLLKRLYTEIKALKVRLHHEKISSESYHYSHGLKKHVGDCQRIAHGHRSAIHIYVNGQRDSQWETYWAERWNQCYLVSEDDLISEDQLSARARVYWHEGLLAHAYRGTQGYFEAMTLTGDTDILPGDTTVESLALYIKNTMHSMLPDTSIEVHAFEGVGKGAIA